MRAHSDRLTNLMTPRLDIVRALIADHPCADESERDSLRRIHALIDQSTEPFSRAHFEPGHLTASGIVLNSGRTHTLLIFSHEAAALASARRTFRAGRV